MKCRETMLDVGLWIPMSCTAPYLVRTLTEQSSKVIGLKYERCCLYIGTFEGYFTQGVGTVLRMKFMISSWRYNWTELNLMSLYVLRECGPMCTRLSLIHI